MKQHEDYREWICGCGTFNAQWKVPRICTNCGTPRGAMTPEELKEYNRLNDR